MFDTARDYCDTAQWAIIKSGEGLTVCMNVCEGVCMYVYDACRYFCLPGMEHRLPG